MKQQRNNGVTLGLNFFFPGAGHLYASGGEEGAAMLIFSIVMAVLTPMLVFPGILALIVWIAALAGSGEITNKYNALAEEQQQTAVKAVEDQRRKDKQAAAALTAKEAERKAEELGRKAAEAEHLKRRVIGEELAKQMVKVSALKKAGVLTDDEAKDELGKLLKKAADGWTNEGLSDFLGPFALLLEQGSIAANELDAAKELHKAIFHED